jgi:hypothetical protein
VAFAVSRRMSWSDTTSGTSKPCCAAPIWQAWPWPFREEDPLLPAARAQKRDFGLRRLKRHGLWVMCYGFWESSPKNLLDDKAGAAGAGSQVYCSLLLRNPTSSYFEPHDLCILHIQMLEISHPYLSTAHHVLQLIVMHLRLGISHCSLVNGQLHR